MANPTLTPAEASFDLRIERSSDRCEAYDDFYDLPDEHLTGCLLSGATVNAAPKVENLATLILAAIGEDARLLEMEYWHSGAQVGPHHCHTTHCLAGWAIHLAGKPGYDLEEAFGSPLAGALIWAASTGERIPNFYGSNEEALAELRQRAADEAAVLDCREAARFEEEGVAL